MVGANCNASQRAAILSYGGAFLSALAPVLAEEQRNGAFVTSCICHACDWGSLALGGKTATAHFSDWYHGRTSGANATALDARGPNGDGALGREQKEPGWANCSDGFFPPPAGAAAARKWSTGQAILSKREATGVAQVQFENLEGGRISHV